MTSRPPTHPDPSSEVLREEAALWFSRMRGPDAELCRLEFEAWLARDDYHHRAYNRVAEVFSFGKILREKGSLPNARMPSRTAVLGAMVAMVLVVWIGAASLLPWHEKPVNPQVANIADLLRSSRFATGRGEVRSLRLPDGSMVTLDTDSLLTLSYDATSRRLSLEQGRARFDVAHEARRSSSPRAVALSRLVAHCSTSEFCPVGWCK